MNNHGQSIGVGLDLNKKETGILAYPNGTIIELPGLNQDACGSGQAFELYDINDFMEIAGLCNTYPMKYSIEEGIMILTESGRQFTARAINNNGQVAGNGELSGLHATDGLVFLSNGTIVNLGTLDESDSYPNAYAYDINNVQKWDEFGQVVGYSESPYSTQQAFVYTNGSMLNIGQIMFEGVNSWAYQINNHGIVVGHGVPHGSLTAFIYDSEFYEYETFSGYDFVSINDKGWIVGANNLYIDGVFYGLNAITLPIDGIYYYWTSLDINDKKQILAIQRYNNKDVGYALLNPI
jgi:probable HAF family extracellular repeat protein